MTTTGTPDTTPAWRALLPAGGRIGVCTQVGRVFIPESCPRQTITMTGARLVRAVRACWPDGRFTRWVTIIPGDGRTLRTINGLSGGEIIEFAGQPCEWHDRNGGSCYAVVVHELEITARRSMRRPATTAGKPTGARG